MARLSIRFVLPLTDPRSLAATDGIAVAFFSCAYLDVSVLHVRSLPLCIQSKVSQRDGLPHSDIFGSQLVYQLPEAFRRLPRPSSPLDAKTFTVCPYGLATPNSRHFKASSLAVARSELEPIRSCSPLTRAAKPGWCPVNHKFNHQALVAIQNLQHWAASMDGAAPSPSPIRKDRIPAGERARSRRHTYPVVKDASELWVQPSSRISAAVLGLWSDF